MRLVENTDYSEKRNALATDYVEFFETLGYCVQPVPNGSRFIRDRIFAKPVDLIVLSGGNRVLSEDLQECDDCYIEREKTETLLLKTAMAQSIPLLGICRGAQFINVALGGTLLRNAKGHVATRHRLISSDSVLDGEIVNSFHGDTIAKEGLAPPLRSLAWSEEGYIEAFRHDRLPIFGVMWHPERGEFHEEKRRLKHILEGKL